MHFTIGAYDQCIYEHNNNYYKQLVESCCRPSITVIGICSIIILRAIRSSATIISVLVSFNINCLNRIILIKTLPTSTIRTQSNLFVKWQYCWNKRTRISKIRKLKEIQENTNSSDKYRWWWLSEQDFLIIFTTYLRGPQDPSLNHFFFLVAKPFTASSFLLVLAIHRKR